MTLLFHKTRHQSNQVSRGRNNPTYTLALPYPIDFTFCTVYHTGQEDKRLVRAEKEIGQGIKDSRLPSGENGIYSTTLYPTLTLTLTILCSRPQGTNTCMWVFSQKMKLHTSFLSMYTALAQPRENPSSSVVMIAPHLYNSDELPGSLQPMLLPIINMLTTFPRRVDAQKVYSSSDS